MSRHQGSFLWQRRLVFCLILGLTAFAVLASRAVVQSVSAGGLVHTRAPRQPTDEPDDLPRGGEPRRGSEVPTSPPVEKTQREAPPALGTASASVIHADVARRCGYEKPRSFEPLGSFSFWGKTMNSSWPCPTSGMNNQFTMLVALFHCAMGGGTGNSPREAAFRFKDITCSPTGGRQGKTSYRVGSDDYEYAWMRWSEIFDIERGLASFAAAAGTPERPPSVLCLNDSFTWKEHPSMGRCSTNIGHLYGSESYWAARRVFVFRERYHALARCFVAWAAAGADTTSAADHWQRCHSQDGEAGKTARLVGIHVRRGDYEGFCKGIVHNSGKSRFRTPPFVYFGTRKATALSVSKQVMRACAPDDRAVKYGLKRALASSAAEGGAHTTVIAVATNAAGLVATLAKDAELKASGAVVSSIGDFVDAVKERTGTPAATWPAALGGGPVTRTDLSVLDMTVLSRADAAVLNRYSTFSQSAIDERIIRSPKAMVEGTLAGMQLFWW
jgi:hypothetical protein